MCARIQRKERHIRAFGRVADCSGLENRRAVKGSGGSNPPMRANSLLDRGGARAEDPTSCGSEKRIISVGFRFDAQMLLRRASTQQDIIKRSVAEYAPEAPRASAGATKKPCERRRSRARAISYHVFCPCTARTHAVVAQLVERLICNQQAEGSIPSDGSSPRKPVWRSE